jgi:hypothetical protein
VMLACPGQSYTVVAGDTLYAIAQWFLGNGNLWVELTPRLQRLRRRISPSARWSASPSSLREAVVPASPNQRPQLARAHE